VPDPEHTGQAAAVSYERRGAAALITIDRQHRRNAVDGPTAAALHDAYLRFEADDEARVLVLAGAGGVSFCAGADLKATETFAGRLMNPEGPMGFTRLTPSKPTIAAGFLSVTVTSIVPGSERRTVASRTHGLRQISSRSRTRSARKMFSERTDVDSATRSAVFARWFPRTAIVRTAKAGVVVQNR